MGKYDDCIIYSESMDFPKGRPLPWIAKLDDQPVFRCSYSIHWNMPFDETKEPKPAPGQRIVGHPPHMHKEMEKHVIKRSCCLRIPGGTPHGFYHVNRCTRPWLFVEVQEANPKTEKFLWEYLTPEEKASIPDAVMSFWQDVGYED